MSKLNAPSEITEKEYYEKGYIEGLLASQGHIYKIREFLRGSTYSIDRLVNMIKFSIDEEIKDLKDSKRILCQKGINHD